MNLLEAFDGPFSTWLGNAEPWKPWRVFIKTMTASPLTDDERSLFRQCTGRQKEFTAPISEAWIVVGRRGRKSAIASIIGVHSAVFHDWSGVVAPGESARVLIVAVTKDQAKIIRSYVEAILRSHPHLEDMIESVDSESVTLTNGIKICCVANSFRSIRGPAVVCAIFEELAFWRSDESATPDIEILRAVRPAMLTTKKHGALLIGISSPYAKKGLLYEKWKEHFGQDESNVLIWQSDSKNMNPELDEDEISQAYKDDPQSASSEYGGLFRDDIQNFLDADLLNKLVRHSPLELPYQEGKAYFGFVDPSGGRGDAFTLGISHLEKNGLAVLDLIKVVQPPFDPATVTRDLSEILKRYHLHQVTGDGYSAEWVKKEFEANRITYKVSPIYKSQIYLETLPQFTQGLVELPDLRALLVELAQLERRTQRGGKDSVDHPNRCHDDMANAACGALHLAALSKNKGTKPGIIPVLGQLSNNPYGRPQEERYIDEGEDLGPNVFDPWEL